MFPRNFLFILVLIITSFISIPTQGQSSTTRDIKRTATLGYDFLPGTTVLGEKQLLLSKSGVKFFIQELPESCFSTPGVTEMYGFDNITNASVATVLENVGLMYGQIEITCSEEKITAQLYAALTNNERTRTRLINKLSDRNAIIFSELKLLTENRIKKRSHTYVYEDGCLVFSQASNRPSHAFCSRVNAAKDFHTVLWDVELADLNHSVDVAEDFLNDLK